MNPQTDTPESAEADWAKPFIQRLNVHLAANQTDSAVTRSLLLDARVTVNAFTAQQSALASRIQRCEEALKPFSVMTPRPEPAHITPEREWRLAYVDGPPLKTSDLTNAKAYFTAQHSTTTQQLADCRDKLQRCEEALKLIRHSKSDLHGATSFLSKIEIRTAIENILWRIDAALPRGTSLPHPTRNEGEKKV